MHFENTKQCSNEIERFFFQVNKIIFNEAKHHSNHCHSIHLFCCVQVEQKQRHFKLCYTSIVYMAFNLAIIPKMLVKLNALETLN